MPVTMTYEEWAQVGLERFGPDRMDWMFVCPVCGHVAAAREWVTLGAPEGAIGFSCVGRWVDKAAQALTGAKTPVKGPCNYAGGGLFRLNPVHVQVPGGSDPHQVFEFAPMPDLSEEVAP